MKYWNCPSKESLFHGSHCFNSKLCWQENQPDKTQSYYNRKRLYLGCHQRHYSDQVSVMGWHSYPHCWASVGSVNLKSKGGSLLHRLPRDGSDSSSFLPVGTRQHSIHPAQEDACNSHAIANPSDTFSELLQVLKQNKSSLHVKIPPQMHHRSFWITFPILH